VLVVIVGGDAAACDEMRARTSYAGVDVIAAAPVAAELNVAVREHPSDVVLFVDAALEPQNPDWLHAMLEYAQQPAIGAVGARLRYVDGRVRHICDARTAISRASSARATTRRSRASV
jgi:hypothetical protein